MLFESFLVLLTLILSVHSDPEKKTLVASDLPPYTYLMRDSLLWIDDNLEIYDRSGNVAFLFSPVYLDPRRGKSKSVTIEKSTNLVLSLRSNNDICHRANHFRETLHGRDYLMDVTLKPRSILADQWNFKVKTDTGYQEFVFHRNTFNKNGNIYFKESKELVAVLTTSVRHDPWLHPGKKGVRVYVIQAFSYVAPIYLVTLMGLVLREVDQCGL